jgi:hypothetical protein
MLGSSEDAKEDKRKDRVEEKVTGVRAMKASDIRRPKRSKIIKGSRAWLQATRNFFFCT